MKYAYSHDQENYQGSFDTAEEAVAEAAFEARESCGEDEQAGIDVGVVLPAVSAGSLMLDAECVIERIEELMYDDVPEGAEDHFSKVPKAALDELTATFREAFDAWCTKHDLQPTWYGIGKTVEVAWDVDEDEEKNAANAVAAYRALDVRLP